MNGSSLLISILAFVYKRIKDVVVSTRIQTGGTTGGASSEEKNGRIGRGEKEDTHPSWDFDHHVQDSLGLIRVKRNVMERRDDRSILFDINSMLCLISNSSSVSARIILPIKRRNVPRVLAEPMIPIASVPFPSSAYDQSEPKKKGEMRTDSGGENGDTYGWSSLPFYE